MSIVRDILEELLSVNLNYKGMRVNIFGIPRFNKYPKRSVRVTIDRLHRKGLVEKEATGIILSKSGKEYIRRKVDSLENFKKPRNLSKDKNLLLMFDIPTERKAEREWLRWHLKKFDFVMVQKSVWVGPFPLPKEFKEYLKYIKLDKCIKSFKLAKSYVE